MLDKDNLRRECIVWLTLGGISVCGSGEGMEEQRLSIAVGA